MTSRATLVATADHRSEEPTLSPRDLPSPTESTEPVHPWVARAAAVTVALCALSLVVLLLPACRPLGPPPATGTVSSVRPDPGAPDRRLLVTVRDAEGHEWNVRLPLDTACVRDAAYPACAG